MCALDPGLASRLAKVCGLLGSDHDGERAAAAWQATKLLRNAGLTWSDVIGPALSAPQPSPSCAPPSSRPYAAKVAWALRYAAWLTEWEHNFLRDVARRRRLSPKQAAVLEKIDAKLREAGAT